MTDNRFPEQITPTLDKVLRLSHSDLVPLAAVFRAAGHEFATDPTGTAAFVRFQLVRLAVNYPEFLAPAPTTAERVRQAVVDMTLAMDDIGAARMEWAKQGAKT